MTPKKEKFEDYLKQVEEVVRVLESGKLGLDESMEKYEQGAAALQKCHQLLEQAEMKIKLLVKQKDGSLEERDFDPSEKTDRKK